MRNMGMIYGYVISLIDWWIGFFGWSVYSECLGWIGCAVCLSCEC